MAFNFSRLMMAGLGAVALTKEKAEKLVDDLVSKGEVKKEEASTLLEELVTKGESTRTEVSDFIKGEVNKFIKDSNLVTREEVEEIKKRLEQLEESSKVEV